MPHSSPATHSLVVHAQSAPLQGICSVPGDKSISHRSLMLASMAEGVTQITGLLEGEDVLRTADAMRAMGAEIEKKAAGHWQVKGRGIQSLKEPDDVLDMGNSGTAARLLSGILASHSFTSVMTGDASLRSRPMMRVITPLSQLGATFMYREGGCLPLTIRGAKEPSPLTYRLPIASAQVKSAVLLSGLNCKGVTTVEESVLSRDHTENMLRHFGVEVDISPLEGGGRLIRLQGQSAMKAKDIQVPGDPSSAAFLAVAALIVEGSYIVVSSVGLNPLRSGLYETLAEMGADISLTHERLEGGEKTANMHVRFSRLKGVTVPAHRVPSMVDEFPILAIAAACASGTSRFCGLGELRVKESDRLAATQALLVVNGIEAVIEDDDLIITGTDGHIPGGGTVTTHMDHRLAMSASVLGMVAQKPVTIDDTTFISTSFPDYFPLMKSIGAEFDNE